MAKRSLEIGTLKPSNAQVVLAVVLTADPKRSVGRSGHDGSGIPSKGERGAIETFGVI
jgi:hypothetical protein